MLTIVDSVSLSILSDFELLTGVGNQLHVHTKDASHTCPYRLRSNIHGIEKAGDKLIIYGGRDLAILRWQQANDGKLLYEGSARFWISNVKFLPRNEGLEFVVLQSNCTAIHYRFSAGTLQRLDSSVFTDHCLLYCSHLFGDTWDELTVFGGNAFGELIIWRPKGVDSSKLERHQMHNGVIFSIDYDHASGHLITTSDDRSIRFWQVDLTEQDNFHGAKPKAIASGYAHTARVFKGKLINYENRQYAITVGEDSHFCVWLPNGELLFKRRQHFGAIIWNLAFHQSTLYTTSSTGNLLAYDLKDILVKPEEKRGTEAVIWSYDKGETGEYVAKIKYLSEHLLIGVTNRNQIVLGTEQGGQLDWQLVQEGVNFKVTVLEVLKGRIALCGYRSYALFELNSTGLVKVKEVSALEGTIRACQLLDKDSFALSDDKGGCLLVQKSVEHQIVLPKSKEQWLTASLLIDNAFLVASNRQGNVLLYQKEDGKFHQKDTLKHLHGFLGSTQLTLLESRPEEAFVKSSGHDDSLKTLRICKSSGRLSLSRREVIPLAWVERMLVHRGEDLLMGFNDNHFVVWSRDRDIVMQTPCGGGHRCWDFWLTEDGTLRLAFIRNKKVVQERQQLLLGVAVTPFHIPERNKWHVKPCNVFALIEETASENTLISAGDDNLIKITRYNTKTGVVQQNAEIHSHISNIRALKVLSCTDEAFIFSGGGRAQLCVTQVNLATSRCTDLLSYTLKEEPKSSPLKQQNYSFNPETRIMACDVLQGETDKSFAIFLGCSDGFFRKLLLSSDMTITMAAELFYGRCMLQVRCVRSDMVLVAATDGLIRFFDTDLSEVMPELRLQHHSSGVNALDLHFDEADNHLHILTGGDDESITYSVVNLANLTVVEKKNLPQLHTAQVTGVHLLRRQEEMIAFTCGVDQVVNRYNLSSDCVEATFQTSVSDAKGLSLDAAQRCHVYGWGLQIFEFPK